MDYEVFDIARTTFVWKNKNGNSIEFYQYTLNNFITVDNEHADILPIEDNGICIYLRKNAYGMKTYFWNNNECQFSLCIKDADVSTEDGMEMVRSIVKYEK